MQATAVMEVSPQQVLKLFESNERVAEYNKFYAEGRVLECINENTKVGGTCVTCHVFIGPMTCLTAIALNCFLPTGGMGCFTSCSFFQTS